jgi:replicative DNA helicase
MNSKPALKIEKPFGFESLPNDLTAEESLLSACVQSVEDSQSATDLLSDDDFYAGRHQQLFAAIKVVASNPNLNKSGPLDFSELVSVMTGMGIDKPAQYIIGLISDIPLAVNIAHTCGIIKEQAILRKAIGILHACTRDCMARNGNSAEVIDRLQQNILAIDAGQSAGNDLVHTDSLLEFAIEKWETASRASGLTGITSGFSDIDFITSGFQNSDLILLAARPAMGKTAAALNMAMAAAEDGNPVLFFSLEMSSYQLMTRLVSGKTGINSKRLQSGRLSSDDWAKVSEAAARIHASPLFISDTPNIHFSEFRRKLRIAFKKHGIRFAVVDYVGLMRGEMSYHNRVEEVASVSRAIKATARELNIPILVLSQLNRNLETRNNKHPILSDLRESGALEQDSDLVLMLYRDEVYNRDQNNPHRGKAEIEITKNRNGALGVVLLAFDATTTTFRDIYRETN